MEEKRLSKVLAEAGVASRRACEKLIFSGRVKVNGSLMRVPQTLVNGAKDRIHLDEQPVFYRSNKLYFLLNKPFGYLCTNVRPRPRDQIVLDLFSHYSERLYSVGRLDKETTGLLLVTNDGHFAHRVIHPSAHLEKEYLVKVDEEVLDSHLKTLSEGAAVEDRWVRPVCVRKVRRGTLKICVKEGRKHEVRLIVKRARLHLRELKRIRIGGLLLGALPEGAFRPLTEREKEMLLKKR
jgi:23S rRNA pseudouridine2605 synthase